MYCKGKSRENGEKTSSVGLRLESHQEPLHAGVFWKDTTAFSILISNHIGIKGTLPELKSCSVVQSFQLKVKFAFYLKIKILKSGKTKNPRCSKSTQNFMWSVTIWGVKWSGGDLPGDFNALHASIKLYGASDFHFQQGLSSQSSKMTIK